MSRRIFPKTKPSSPLALLAAGLLIVGVVVLLFGEIITPKAPDVPDFRLPPASRLPSPSRSRHGEFERLIGCQILTNSKRNDGDSFQVDHDGEIYTFRLYFVDTPETSIHRRTEKRIFSQAQYFGISSDEAVDVGNKAHQLLNFLLSQSPFTIVTKWERVFDSDRFYAFVLLKNETGDEVYLHEILVQHGLARIYTKGHDLPNGVSRNEQLKRLKALEQDARNQRLGGWRKE